MCYEYIQDQLININTLNKKELLSLPGKTIVVIDKHNNVQYAQVYRMEHLPYQHTINEFKIYYMTLDNNSLKKCYLHSSNNSLYILDDSYFITNTIFQPIVDAVEPASNNREDHDYNIQPKLTYGKHFIYCSIYGVTLSQYNRYIYYRTIKLADRTSSFISEKKMVIYYHTVLLNHYTYNQKLEVKINVVRGIDVYAMSWSTLGIRKGKIASCERYTTREVFNFQKAWKIIIRWEDDLSEEEYAVFFDLTLDKETMRVEPLVFTNPKASAVRFKNSVVKFA